MTPPITSTARSGADATDGIPPPVVFPSDIASFSRVTQTSYAWADLLLSVVWVLVLIMWAPSAFVFLPGLSAGVIAIAVDYVWFYRTGRREVRVNDRPASSRFLLWWLVLYFDFLIAFDIGCYVGWVLLVGPGSLEGLAVTAGVWLWFCAATPVASRLLLDLGRGRDVVSTVRRTGPRGTWLRLALAVGANATVCITLLDGDPMRAAGLFGVGMLAAGAMETPLYALGIRPGRDAWKAWILNTICEWNYGVPVSYALLVAVGALA